MSKKFTSILFLLFSAILFSNFQAQTTQNESVTNHPSILQGLKKAEPGDIKPGTPLMLDPMSTPMYDEQLQKINPADFMKIMMSNEFIPEPYLDEKKTVKAFVLRRATPDEKAMMEKLQRGEMAMDQQKNELIGTKGIDFNLKDIKGKTHKLSELKGKVVVLNFWFVECKPCITEMPELNDLIKEFKDQDVEFISIALNAEKEIKKFLKKNTFNYSIISDGQATAQTYQVKGYPTNIIIDKSGIIQYVSTGVGPNNKENLQKAVNQLLPN